MNRRLIITADGSHTLEVEELNEHYHSTYGAINESQHVYINSGLLYARLKQINLLEIGFGTGLNAILSLIAGQKNKLIIHYHSLEKYSLEPDIIHKLNYPAHIPNQYKQLFKTIHEVSWNKQIEICTGFTLEKTTADILTCSLSKLYNVVYFDAFAPSKQPEIWCKEIFQKIYSAMHNNAVLTTYSATGRIRRQLQDIGFGVTLIPGPTGKREMIRAVK
jgi:tRNA U34 5-methylaminomethyl-2-thiouridine-forming methyltransferase MnmC